MAVRIDKTVSQKENIANNYATLKSYLLRRAGRKLNDVEYIGLLRNNALGDLNNPGEALTNILEYITRVDDAGEIALYGTYKPEDFEITRSFVQNEITSDFLRPLANISIAGGAAGAAVATNPRIRIQDRINLLDSFTGKGSISGLAKGPTALFYRTRPGKLETLGTIVFNDASILTTGEATSPTITLAAGIDNNSITGYKHAFLITSYLNGSTSEEVSLLGTGLFLEYDATDENGAVVVKAGSVSSLSRLKEIEDILGGALFNATTFTIEREYSALVKPDWFSFSPGSDKEDGATVPLPGGPDDFNPATSDAVVFFERGKFKLYTEPEYYNSGNYIFDRIPTSDRDAYTGNNITKDSNMRFMRPPRVVRANTYNWGVRWDGYLRLDKVANPRKYIFEVETNTGIKIDIYNGGVNLAGEVINAMDWEKAFDSSYGAVQTLAVPDTDGSVKLAQETDRHVSRRSFTLDGIEASTANKYHTFRYDTALDASTQIRYVPISIRMWNGGVDRVDSEQELFEIPLDPNLFLKYAYSETDPGTQDEFFAGDFQVSIASDDTTGTVTTGSDDLKFIDDILGAANAKVSYSLVKKIVSETITYIDGAGNEVDELIETEQEITPIDVLVTGPDGGNLTITDTASAVIAGLTDGVTSVVYTVRVTPNRSGYSYTTLWSTNIIGPKQQDYQGYADLLGGKTYAESDPNYIEPLTNKLTLDQRPEWWKVSDGNRFLPGTAISKENNPLDGFKSNSFASVLRSSESPVGSHEGLYGDGGSGTSRIFSDRRNIVFGEAKYSGDQDGSNYLGLRLTSNFLGEGGKLNFTGIPINNATFDWTGETENQNKALGQDDLGGDPNHRTAVSTNLTVKTDKFYWDGPGGDDVNGTELFFLHDNIGDTPNAPIIAQDNPLTSALPPFGGADDAVWAQPIIVIATSAGGNKFEAPLVLGVQKVIYDKDQAVGGRIITDTTTALSGNQVYLLAFSTSFEAAYTTDDIDGSDVTYYNEADVAFQFASVDSGESISFSDVLKATYTNALIDGDLNPSGFNSSASEVPKVPSERVTPFGFDSPIYTPDICYPPYVTSSPDLKPTVVLDPALYSTTAPKPANHFDVFWGNHTEDNRLMGPNFGPVGEPVLNITEKLEFSFVDPSLNITSDSPAAVVQPASGIQLNFNNYSHRLKIELPIFKVDTNDTSDAAREATAMIPLDEDVYVHIGDQSKVKDVYYLFVNGRNDLSDAASGNLPGL